MEGLLAVFHQLDGRSAALLLLDVLIVAAIIYRVLLLIRGTHAAYMLAGMLVMGFIFLAARQLALGTLGWLLDHVLNYLILIIIIVFQADIRRGLMRMGWRMFTPSRSNDDLTTIEEVVQACESLAKKHHGALIILERGAGLTEYLESGSPLQAVVNRALLANIFAPWPDNPLHDGAVVIKDKWIHYAGVILPLSRNPGLDKDLGTRHRAAVGITEETDAIAVVVSEQRGTIGLCHQGVLHMSLPPPILRRELLALLAPGAKLRWRSIESLKRVLGRVMGPEASRPVIKARHTGQIKIPQAGKVSSPDLQSYVPTSNAAAKDELPLSRIPTVKREEGKD